MNIKIMIPDNNIKTFFLKQEKKTADATDQVAYYNLLHIMLNKNEN